MNIENKKRLMTAVLACIGLLAGCMGSDISLVKDSRMKGWPDYTVGQMLDKRKACSKTEWKSFKDDRDRVIVEYTCTHEPGTKYVQELNENEMEREKKAPAELAGVLDRYLKEREETVGRNREMLQEFIEQEQHPDKIAQAKVGLEIAEREYLKMKQNHEESARNEQARNAERLALLERRIANFREVNEVFQWVIQEKTPVFLTSQIKVIFSDADYGWTIDKTTMFNMAVENAYEVRSGYDSALKELVGKYGKR